MSQRRPLAVTDSDGNWLFSFNPMTDPYNVLRAVAWAYYDISRGFPRSLCCAWPGWGCPSTEGRYCIDCHSVGSMALARARRLPEALELGQRPQPPQDTAPC